MAVPLPRIHVEEPTRHTDGFVIQCGFEEVHAVAQGFRHVLEGDKGIEATAGAPWVWMGQRGGDFFPRNHTEKKALIERQGNFCS